MNKISIKKLRDIDIKLFFFMRHLLFTMRVKIYIVIFLIIIREIFLKTPYLNILIADNRDVVDAITIPILIAVILGFNSKILILIAVLLFLPVAALSVLGHEILAEFLSNNIYVLLVIGIIGMVIRFVKQENE